MCPLKKLLVFKRYSDPLETVDPCSKTRFNTSYFDNLVSQMGEMSKDAYVAYEMFDLAVYRKK